MGSFVLMIAAVIAKVAGLIFRIPLTNILGGVGMGYYSSAYTVYTPVYAICAGSITPAITQYISYKSANKDKDSLIAIRNRSLWIFGSVGFVVSSLMMGLSGIIAERIVGNDDAKYAIAAIAPCVFVEAVTAVYRGYFEGQMNMTPTAISQVTEAITRVIFGLGFAYIFADRELPVVAGAVVWGVTLSNVASLVYLIIKSGKGESASSVIDCKGAVKTITSLMVPIALASLASSLMNWADLTCIVIGLQNALKENPALYSQKYSEVINSGVSLDRLPNFLYGTLTGLSFTVFTLVPSLCGVLGRSALPTISHDYASGNMDSVRKEIKRMILITVYISLPAGLGISAMADKILSILFSSRAVEVQVATEPLRILGLSAVFLCVSSTAFAMLQAVGRQDLPLKITVAGAVIKLAGNILLIPLPSLELSGAAISTAVSYGVMGICAVVCLYRLTGVKYSPLGAVIIPLIGSVLAVAVAKFCEVYIVKSLSKCLNMGISVTFAVIIYIIVIVLLDKVTKNKILAKIFSK